MQLSICLGKLGIVFRPKDVFTFFNRNPYETALKHEEIHEDPGFFTTDF